MKDGRTPDWRMSFGFFVLQPLRRSLALLQQNIGVLELVSAMPKKTKFAASNVKPDWQSPRKNHWQLRG
jgi:hypothetical protein